MKLYDVRISEVYSCITTVEADSKEEALLTVQKLYDEGCIELDNEDIEAARYEIV